jgi:hypothetical protein
MKEDFEQMVSKDYPALDPLKEITRPLKNTASSRKDSVRVQPKRGNFAVEYILNDEEIL